MQDYIPNEVLAIIESEASDAWQEGRIRKALKTARSSAYVYRKRNRRKLPETTNKIIKKAIRSENKHVSRLARRIILRAKGRIRGKVTFDSFPPSALMAKMKRSILLDGLYPERRTEWTPIYKRIKSRETDEINVENFCFLSNPEKTLENLVLICRAEAKFLSSKINFIDEICLDIGAWLVLAAARSDMAPVFSGGEISNSITKVISSLGLKQLLRFSVEAEHSHEKDIWSFPLRTRRRAGSSTSLTQHIDPQAAEKVGGELCDALNEWLGECIDHSLTTQGRRSVKKIVGETLDNAERHSRREYENDGDWLLTGFMAKREGPNGPLFRFQLAFLSIGSSISDTIQDAPSVIIQEMEKYVRMHATSMPNHKFAEQHLRTVYALQDTVTRDHSAAAEGRGGTGFRDIICLFSDLASLEAQNNDASLCIVSGRTCLHIAHEHAEAAFPAPGERFNIWLNEHNRKEHPPLPYTVKDLANQFCGTLVTMGFTLDRGFLERASDDPD